MDVVTSDESQWILGTRTINQLRKIVTTNKKLSEVIVFKNEYGQSVATISVIYKKVAKIVNIKIVMCSPTYIMYMSFQNTEAGVI